MLPADCGARYRPLRRIASGGFGTVWECEQLDLQRRVALKILHDAATPDLVARFLLEARVTAQLTHPHIVIVHDHGAATGVPWIAYELLPGPSLAARTGPQAPAVVAPLLGQVARALEAAHAQGILHRDIKPDNILEASPTHVKVADFGIARWSGAHQVRTQTGLVLGTPHYLAPEVIEGGDPTPASDIYALAIVLFELLEGRRPFDSPNLIELLGMHIQVPAPALAPGGPPALARLVARGLAKDPAARPHTAAEFAAALDEALQEPARRHLRGSEATAPRPEGTPRPVPRGASGLALAAAAALCALLFLARPRPPAAPTPASADPRAEFASAVAALDSADAPARDAALQRALATALAAPPDQRAQLWFTAGDRPGLTALVTLALRRQLDASTAGELYRKLAPLLPPRSLARESVAARATALALRITQLRPRTDQTSALTLATARFVLNLHEALGSSPDHALAEHVELAAAVNLHRGPRIPGLLPERQWTRVLRILAQAVARRLRAAALVRPSVTSVPELRRLEELLARLPAHPPAPAPRYDGPPLATFALPAATRATIAAMFPQRCATLKNLDRPPAAWIAEIQESDEVEGCVSGLEDELSDTPATDREVHEIKDRWLAGLEPVGRGSPWYWTLRARMSLSRPTPDPVRQIASLDWSLYAIELALDGWPVEPTGQSWPRDRRQRVRAVRRAAAWFGRLVAQMDPDHPTTLGFSRTFTTATELNSQPTQFLRNACAVMVQRAVRALMPTDRGVQNEAEGAWAAFCGTGQELIALGHMARCDALEPAHRAFLLEETKTLAAAYPGERCGEV